MNERAAPKQYVVSHIREALALDGRVSELELDVTIAGGKVFLTGEVATPERKEAATEILAELLPDAEIVNEIEVWSQRPPEGTETIS